MSQAQRNQGQSARVHTLPPPPLGRASQNAPAARGPRSTLPPPLAATQRLPSPQLSLAPRLSVPAPAHLAIVPLWDDANLPLRPAPKQQDNAIYWIGSATVSLAVGALIAASLTSFPFGDGQILPRAHAESGLHALSGQMQLAAAAALQVQGFEGEEPIEIELEAEMEQVSPASRMIVIPELTVTSRKSGKAATIIKASNATKQAKIGPIRKSSKQRGKRSRTMLAAQSVSQPDPQDEVKAPSVVEAPAARVAQPVSKAATGSATAEAAAPEVAARQAAAREPAASGAASFEPATPELAARQAAAREAAVSGAALVEGAARAGAARLAAARAGERENAAPAVVAPSGPALPDKLTRDQVRAGLDRVRSKVLACAKGTYGRVLADVTVSAPGRVSSALVEGTFAGTKAGSCMENTIRNAKFPTFSGPDISVRYPYSF